MKRLLLFSTLIVSGLGLIAQNSKYKSSIGLHFGTYQYNGDVSDELWRTKDLHGAFGISYSTYLNKALDFDLMFSHGLIDASSDSLAIFGLSDFRTPLNNFTGTFRYKFNNGYILREDFPVSPFLALGIGDVIYKYNVAGVDGSTLMDFNFPMGGGLKFRINDRWDVMAQSLFFFTLTDELDGQDLRYLKSNRNDRLMLHTIGVKYNFNCGKDKDKDGIADEEDKCPESAGTLDNKGCPAPSQEVIGVMEMAMRGLFFKTGSDEIEPSSYAVLDNVVGIMKSHPEFNLFIGGHTDNTGGEELNMKLSKERANAARVYIINKGIENTRITAAGFGQTQPVAGNDTEEGRAQNRRVEFKIVF